MNLKLAALITGVFITATACTPEEGWEVLGFLLAVALGVTGLVPPSECGIICPSPWGT